MFMVNVFDEESNGAEMSLLLPLKAKSPPERLRRADFRELETNLETELRAETPDARRLQLGDAVAGGA
jgi:hypothetical protein